MSIRLLRNEFAKLRRLRVGLLIAALTAGLVVVTILSLLAVGEGLDPAHPTAWSHVLAGLSLAVPVMTPMLVAVIASRATEAEHGGQGWLLHATAGVRPGTLARAKILALSLPLAVAMLVACALPLLLGRVLVGISAPLPWALWAQFAASVTVVTLALLALHVLLSTWVENQLLTLAIAVVGTMVALFSRGLPEVFAHLTPWGHYALAEAAGYVDGEMTTLAVDLPSIAVLGVIAALATLALTYRLNTQEV